MARERLPDERTSVTHKFSIAGHEGYLIVGLYPDGRPGEMFVRMAKAGSIVDGLVDSLAIAVSVGLQQGVPMKTYVQKFSFSRFEPSGYTSNPAIRTATSIVDYIFRWIGMRFCPEDTPGNGVHEALDAVIEKSRPSVDVNLSTANTSGDCPPCPTCGAIMRRTGKCHTCPTCGETGGCG